MSPSIMQKRQTIGLLTKSLEEARPVPSWQEAVNFAQQHDVNLLILVGGMLKSPIEYEAQANILYDLINASNLDGLIMTGGLGHYIGTDRLQQFCERFQPLPIVNLEVPLDGIPSVTCDFYTGMRQIMRHLIEDHGYHRLAYIRGPINSKTGEDRYRAYLDSLNDYGIPFDPALVTSGNFFPPSGADSVRVLFDDRHVMPIDAIVSTNDLMAIDAMHALQARGIRVPQDIAVTGFDNLEISRSVMPRLTTVELATHRQIQLASKIILALLRGDPVPDRVEMPTDLVLQQSCGCQLSSVLPIQDGQPLDIYNFEDPVNSGQTTPPWEALTTQRQRILAAMIESCTFPLTSAALDSMTSACDAFDDEIRGSVSGALLQVLKKRAYLPEATGANLAAWQQVLSAHRRKVLPLLTAPAIRQTAENLWQQARVFLAETALNLETQQQFHKHQLEATIRSVGESLITALDMSSLTDTVQREFPRLGIPACYTVLYSHADPSGTDGSLLTRARLVMAYNKNGQIPLHPTGTEFELADMLPLSIHSADQPSCHVVLSLHFHEDQVGYVVFEVGPRNGTMYETLALHLGSALRGALLVQEMKRQATELARAKALAEKADQLKTRLLANVTHELRTPLNIILGVSSAALQESNPYHQEMPDALRRDLGHIQSSGEHLVRLIGDLLDLSRAEIGELDLYPEPLAPRPLLEQAFQSIAGSIQTVPGVMWRLELPPRLPMIQADPTRLRQIVLNLLSNAHKFTASGEIVLGAEVAPPHLHIWVKDTGHGIPIDSQERIFEPFFSERYSSRRPEGVGLGLTITRRLVSLHNGSLSLDSQPGQGSVFHVYIPLPNLNGTISELPDPAARNPTLLLISSTETPLPEVVRMAERSHWTICPVNSRTSLATALSQSEPAAIAWDVPRAHPGDWAIIQQIRANPRLCHLPFILFSELDTAENLVTSSLTNIVTKPVNARTLFELIQAIQPPSKGDHGTDTILIVDDDPDARTLYAQLIADQFPGATVALAEDGRVALDWLTHHTPSLVILDLSMPEIDGFAVLEGLRANPRTGATPVFVLTGRLLAYEDIRRLDHSRVVVQTKQLLSGAEMMSFVQHLAAGTDTLAEPSSYVVKQALAYIHQNYSLTFSRADMAAAIGVSEDHLSRLFAKEMGLSPWEFLNRYRVLHAQRLLRETKERITWIALQSGFEDPAYFSRVFQKVTGCSPRTYRASV